MVAYPDGSRSDRRGQRATGCHKLRSSRSRHFTSGPPSAISVSAMSLRCLLRLHRPMLNSIVRRPEGYAALCDACGLPIERFEEGSWTRSEPLTLRIGRPANGS